MNPLQIQIPGHFIAKTKRKEQVKLDQRLKLIMYYGYYGGMNGFHEFVTNGENIRELTDEELKIFQKRNIGVFTTILSDSPK